MMGQMPTVDVDLALLHEPTELGQPVGCVYFGHVDSAQGSRGVEGSDGREGRLCGYICCTCRVGQLGNAREEHRGLATLDLRRL